MVLAKVRVLLLILVSANVPPPLPSLMTPLTVISAPVVSNVSGLLLAPVPAMALKSVNRPLPAFCTIAPPAPPTLIVRANETALPV